MNDQTTTSYDGRLLDVQEVSTLTSMKRSTLYSAIKHNEFPLPVQLSARRVAWKLDEVLQWIENRPRGLRQPSAKGSAA